MMFAHGWAFSTSPHGASQTIFSPGISGVPDERAIAARSGPSADAGDDNTTAPIAISSRRNVMNGTMPTGCHTDQAASQWSNSNFASFLSGRLLRMLEL